MLSNAFSRSGGTLLACPVCLGPLTERLNVVRCRPCALRYANENGVYLLGPPFAVEPSRASFCSDRMRGLLEEASTLGWEEARGRFTTEVLGGALRAPSRSRWARVRD